MYLIYRCDCGKPQYTQEHYKTHKCTYCNKTIQIKTRRIIARTHTRQEATQYIQELQDKIYHNAGWIKGDQL